MGVCHSCGGSLDGCRGRSARHNGQQPGLKITDPLQLERKLKRQRSDEGEVLTPELSDELGDEREAKRSKMSVSDDGERDPPDNLVSHSVPRQPTVRFAADFPLVQPTSHTGDNRNIHFVQDMPPSPQLTKIAGFDPSLPNPTANQPSLAPYFNGPPLPNLLETFAASSSNFNPNGMFLPIPAQENQAENHAHTHNFALQTPVSMDEMLSPTVQPMHEPEQPPIPMIVERTPTPPPEFHVGQELVHLLKTELRDSTGSLTVEQLEHLRATCLGCEWRVNGVWRTRTHPTPN